MQGRPAYRIQTRLMAIVLLLVLLPLVILGLFLLNLSRRQISTEIQRSAQSALDQSVAGVDQLLQSIEEQAGRLATDRELLLTLDALGHTRGSDWKTYRSLNALYDAMAAAQETRGLSAVYLYDLSAGRFYASARWGDRQSFSGDASDYFAECALPENAGRWRVARTLKTALGDEAVPSIAFSKVVRGRYVLTLHVAVHTLQRQLQPRTALSGSALFLLNSRGDLLDGQDPGALGGRSLSEVLADDAYVSCTRASADREWSYLALQSSEVLIQPQIEVLRRTIWLTMLALALVTLPCIWLLSRSIQAPVKVILGAMNDVEHGDFRTHIEETRSDEFGMIYRQFNYMVEQMNLMIDQLYRRRIESQLAEIKALQAQIKPHFLYNTLDTVHWMARMNRTKEIDELTLALCRYYRLVLSEGADVVPAREALALAQEYLKIQQLRYNYRFSVELDVDAGLNDILVPKLLFQPLAENAVLHGIDSKAAARLIRITGRAEQSRAVFQVWDDGMGILPENLTRIRDLIYSDDVRDLFALRNLYSQLRLLVGGEIEMLVDSVYGEWTCITLRFDRKESQGGETGCIDC